MAGPSYEVALREPEKVRSELLRVWSANLQVRNAEARFAALYRDAPVIPEAVLALETQGDVVGTIGVLDRQFHIGDGDARAGLLADLAVDREHRSLLPALRLVRAGRDYALEHHDLVYGWPNAKAEGVFKRACCQELGRSRRYARVLRHRAYVGRALASCGVPQGVNRAVDTPAVSRVVGAAADVGCRVLDTPRTLRAAAGNQLSWTATDAPELDELWARARDDYPIVAERSARFVGYRFPSGGGNELALLTSRQSGAPRAYAVVSGAGAAAQILDLFGHREALSPLLALLLPALYARGASSASMRYLGSPTVVELLKAHGLVERQETKAIFTCAGRGLAERVSHLGDPANWHLTELDEDA